MPLTKLRIVSTAGLARRRSRDGVALVITLSFLLIATAIVVAFLVRARFDYRASAGYAASVQADLLASGAMDHVVADLVGEIADADRSTAYRIGDFQWFEPRPTGDKYLSMVPEVVTSFGDVGNNLVRQSISAAGAGSENTADSPTRPVSASRWDLPKLLLDAGGTAAATFAKENVPNWIYLKENGETAPTGASSTDISSTVGRYAYNVYDVGGLLNANVAGNEATDPAVVGTKGAVVFADLTRLPGIAVSTVENMLKWRAPYVIWSTLGDPNARIDGPDLSILDYLRMGASSGWLKNPSIDPDRRGNQFFSRRDLIKYLENEGSADALPFLTHFSVDLDAPTFSPGDILKLRDGRIRESLSEGPYLNEGDQPRINPNRFQENTLLSALPLPNGETMEAPVLYKRFPLSRLAWVQTDKAARDAAGSTPALVRESFGLEQEDDFTWNYVDLEGNRTRIKTLADVARENRPPNFFELLKGSIHVGSLGQYKQPVTEDPAGTGGCMEPFADRLDDQILRIGAAIIDQADADSFPTRIRFNYDADSTFGEIYGVEDLPYIQAVRFVNYTGLANAGHKLVVAQPALWNPHNPFRRQQTAGNLVPSKFRVVAKSIGGPVSVVSEGDPSEWVRMTSSTFDGSQSLNFEWEPDSKNFRQPQGLLSALYPPGANLSGSGLTGPFLISQRENSPYTPLAPFAQPRTFGFLLASNLTADPPPTPATVFSSNCKFSKGSLKFSLQYEAGGSSYTYDYLWFNPEVIKTQHAFITPPTFTALSAGKRDPDAPTFAEVRAESVLAKSDPRSHRFIWPSNLARFVGTTPQNRTHYPNYEGTSPGFFGGVYAGGISSFLVNDTREWWEWKTDPVMGSSNDAPDFRSDVGYVSINRIGDPFYYEDHDGVVRGAMGSRASAFPKISSFNEARPPNYYQNRVTGLPLQQLPFRSAGELNQDVGAAFYPNRPVVLNRPFRSVGELAYAFRDVPWKTIDFSFPESGDTALLDVFTVYENDGAQDGVPLVAGKVNLNVAPKPVLEALLQGAAKEIAIGSSPQKTLDEQRISALADRIAAYRSTTGSPSESSAGANGPMRSLAELVGRVYSPAQGNSSSVASFVGLHPEAVAGGDGDDAVMTERLSALARSLADVGTTRTWNLMIDLVAQSGSVPGGAPSAGFQTNAESRWWMFVSIDRFTGQVLARSVERVVE